MLKYASLLVLGLTLLGCGESATDDASGGAGGGGSKALIAGTGGDASPDPAVGGASPDAAQGEAFPATGRLDDFESPPLSPSWTGSLAEYEVGGGLLSCGECFPGIFLENNYSTPLEVYAELSAFAPESQEINVVLLAQDVDCEQIEVSYSPREEELNVFSCLDGTWTTHLTVPAKLDIGSTLGARAVSGSELEIYVDAQLVGTADITEYPFTAGQIGVNGIASTTNAYGSFGGGEL